MRSRTCPPPVQLVVVALVAGFAPEDGSLVWQTTVGLSVGEAAFDDTVVIRSSEGNLRGFDRAPGLLLWCRSMPTSTMSEWQGVASAVGLVAVLDDNQVVAIDPATGTDAWRRQIPVSGRADTADSPVSTVAPVGLGLAGGTAPWSMSPAGSQRGARRFRVSWRSSFPAPIGRWWSSWIRPVGQDR